MNVRGKLFSAGVISGMVLQAVVSSPAMGADVYKVDPVHSSVVFRIKHLGVSYFYGRFNELSGSFYFDESNPEKSKFDITVKAASVDTNSARRERHLKSPDFFNVKQFPKITFKSKAVKLIETDYYEVTGDFTLHGVTKSITVELERVGLGKGRGGGTIMGFETTFVIKRSDFGMSFMLNGLGDEVGITVSVEGGRK